MRAITVTFPLSQGAGYGTPSGAVYDGFSVHAEDADGRAIAHTVDAGGAQWTETFAPGERRTYRVAYRTRATDQWHYRIATGTSRLSNLRLAMTTNFVAVDFPTDGISPSHHEARDGRWSGVWEFESLITDHAIGIVPPERLNPGPLAARITYFAPVGLLFFFFVVGILASAQRVSLHPMHFFFLGCAFFAFHLAFAYLIDHLEIHPSFAIAASTAVALVVSYARLFVGWRFALREMGISMALYLILFSYTFLWEGFTGLSITIGAIITLFVMMQITGRLDWSRSLEPRGRAAPPLETPAPNVV